MGSSTSFGNHLGLTELSINRKGLATTSAMKLEEYNSRNKPKKGRSRPKMGMNQFHIRQIMVHIWMPPVTKVFNVSRMSLSFIIARIVPGYR